MQFSLMDQLPAMAWYEAALREGRSVVAVRTLNRVETMRAVDAMKAAGGHFINRFGRLATEEFSRWQGPEPAVRFPSSRARNWARGHFSSEQQ